MLRIKIHAVVAQLVEQLHGESLLILPISIEILGWIPNNG